MDEYNRQTQPVQTGQPVPLPPPNMYVRQEENPQVKHERAVHFKAMLPATFVYAFFFTLFLYDNFSSYTMPLFVVATTLYCDFCMAKMGVGRKRESVFYIVGMFLLGVSSFLTGNGFIIFCNTVGIALLLICMLLHNFYDDSKWGFGKYVHSIFCVIFGTIGNVGEPLTDASCYQKEAKGQKNSVILYIVIGVAIALPLLLIVILLLSSADAVFEQFVQNIRWDFGTVVGVGVTFLFGLFAAYCGFRYLGKGTIKAEGNAKKQYEPIVAATVLALLSVVYVFFCMIQILYLFYGKMQLPQEYTYAEYAREGFFQLLFVCILNLLIVLFVLAHFPKRPLLQVLLTVISCCTYIMVASSAFRMAMYVQNYQLSFLRVLVFWGLAVIAFFLAGILVQIFKPDFPLFRYGLVMFSLCYLALSFGRPDYWIARYNVAAAGQNPEKDFDLWYLETLSTDAAPVIADYAHTHGFGLEDDWLYCYVSKVAKNSDEDIRRLNVSHQYAGSCFKEELVKLDKQKRAW